MVPTRVPFSVLALLGLAVLSLAASAPAPIPHGAAPPPLDQALPAVDDYLAAQIAQWDIPALAVAVVEGDRPVHARGFGLASPDGPPVTPNTPFLLASVSKSFTALAIMQLVAAGLIAVDAPVQRYLPWFRVADEEASARITVGDLLYHTSGFSTRTGNEALVTGGPSQTTLENYVRALGGAALDRPPGTTVEYSNTNYRVLGLLVQTLSGESYPAYVRGHILAPLGMEDSCVGARGVGQPPMALPVDTSGGAPRAAPRLNMPAYRVPSGGLVVSAADMTHYLVAQLGDGRYGGQQVLSAAGVQEMHAIGAPTRPDSGAAMGWFVRPVDGETTIWHSGELRGYRTIQMLLPDVNRAFAVFLTLDTSLPDPNVNRIGNDVASHLRGPRGSASLDPERGQALRQGRQVVGMLPRAAGGDGGHRPEIEDELLVVLPR
jgi:CubicO group peptidase (beta-lactamase class C family)